MGEEKEFGFVHHMEVTAYLDAVVKNLRFKGWICSTSDKLDHRVCGNELEHRVLMAVK